MKIVKGILLLLVVSIMQSCGWMDLSPEDQYSIENYWNSKDQVDRFIRGLHGRVRMRQETLMRMGEFRGGLYDIGLNTPFAQTKSDLNIISNSLSLENPGINSFGDFYMDIMQINHALKELPNVTFLSEKEMNYDLGILYGLRAFYYFHLFRTFGGVPKIDLPKVLDGVQSAGELNVARASEKEIYEFVKEDINRSSEYFSDDNFSLTKDKSAYWNKAATLVLKAEILLWGTKVKPIGEETVYSENVHEDLQTAKKILIDVKGHYSSMNKFADVFDVTKKDNSEIIFCIRYNLTEKTNFFNKFLYPESNGNAGGYEFVDGTPVPSPDFLNLANSGSAYNYQVAGETYDMFSPDDSRRDASFIDLYKSHTEPRQRAVLMTKFMGEIDHGFRKFTNDWPIYRYADVVLLLAEISNDLGEDPSDFINEIRLRAYGNKFNSHRYPHNGETADDAILEERSKEFFAEGKRWYDIRRMKQGKVALDLQNITDPIKKEQHLLWPIDNATLNKNPLLEQNKGY